MPTEPTRNTSHSNKTTALHILAGNCHYQDLVSRFDDYENNLESLNEVGDTPLLFAAKRGATQAVSFLIKQGANIHCKDKYNFSLVHALARSGDIRTLSLLLKMDKSRSNKGHGKKLEINGLTSAKWVPVNGDKKFQCQKWSPIQYALHFKHLKMASLLRNNGAKLPNSVNTKSQRLSPKRTPTRIKPDAHGVWHAAKTRNLTLLKKLIDQGAPYFECDSRGNTILHDAILSAKAMPRLALKSALPANGVPRKGLIYISEEKGQIHYSLQTRLGCIVKDTLPIRMGKKEILTSEKLDELTLQIFTHIPMQCYFGTDEQYCSDLALLLLNKYEESRKAYHRDNESLSWLEKQWGALFNSGHQDYPTIFKENDRKKSVIEIALEKGYSRLAYTCISQLKDQCQSEEERPEAIALEYRSLYASVREQVSKMMDKAIDKKNSYLLAHCINAEFEGLIVRESPYEAPIHKAFDKQYDQYVEMMVLGWLKTVRSQSPRQANAMRTKFIKYLNESKSGYGETLAERRAESELCNSLEGANKIYHQVKHAGKQAINHIKWQQAYNANHLRKTYSYKTISTAKTAITVLPSLAAEGAARFTMNAAMNLAGPLVLNAINSTATNDESWLRWSARNGAYASAYFIFYGTNLNAHLAASACGYVGGTLAHYALPEHLELQGGFLALSEILGTYSAWQGPLEPKIPSFYFERMRHEQWPAFIPATLEAFNDLDYYAKQVLSVPENPVHFAAQGLEQASQAAFDSLSNIPLVAPVVRSGQWFKKNANQARERCLDQVELALIDHVMPETYMNMERKAFIAQSEASRLEAYHEELKQQEVQNDEQGISDESLDDKIEQAQSASLQAQEYADSLFEQTPTFKAFVQYQEDFNAYQQAQIDYGVACRTNSMDPQAQAQAIKETEVKKDKAYEKMLNSREALEIYASEDALKRIDEETKKIDHETKEGIQNILDDSCLAPWIDNLIAEACSLSTDKHEIAKFVADAVIKKLFPFGGDQNEIDAKHEEIVGKIVTDDMKGWERSGRRADKAKERAKDNMYQTILAKITGGEIQTRHVKNRWDRVGTYIYGGVSLAASAVTFAIGLPTLSTAMFANGIRCLQNKKGQGDTIPIFRVNMNWDEGGYRSNDLDVSVGGEKVYSTAPSNNSPIQLGSYQSIPSDSFVTRTEPFLSSKMVSPVFLPQDHTFPSADPIQYEGPVALPFKPEEYLPATEFRKVWEYPDFNDIDFLPTADNDTAPPEPETMQEQQSGRKHFQLPHAFDGPKTGNAFIDGVDAFNRGVETARDGVVDAILHPIETAADLAVFAYDMGNLATDKALGLSDANAKARNMERKEALIALGKEFKEGDTDTKIEMATTLGAGMILGGGAGGAAANLGKMTVKKTAAAARAVQKTKNLNPKTAQQPILPIGSKQSTKPNTISKAESKLHTSLAKANHSYPLRSMAAGSGAGVLKSTLPVRGPSKLVDKKVTNVTQKTAWKGNMANANQSLASSVPNQGFSQTSSNGKGLAKTVAHNTAKQNKKLQSLNKASAVGVKGVSNVPNLGATLGATLAKDVSIASKVSVKEIKHGSKPAAYTPGYERIKQGVRRSKQNSKGQLPQQLSVGPNELTRVHALSGKGSATNVGSVNPQSVNAQASLNRKLRALKTAQSEAARIETLPDGRIRYYMKERPPKKPGPTRGSSHVTEYNPATGQVRAWSECYDHSGNVNRIHPKMIDGQQISGQHYPPTKKEINAFSNKPRGPK